MLIVLTYVLIGLIHLYFFNTRRDIKNVKDIAEHYPVLLIFTWPLFEIGFIVGYIRKLIDR